MTVQPCIIDSGSMPKRLWYLMNGIRGRALFGQLAAIAEGVLEALILTLFAHAGLGALNVVEPQATSAIVVWIPGGLPAALGLAITLRLIVGVLRVFWVTQIHGRISGSLRDQLLQAFLAADWETKREFPDGTVLQIAVAYPKKAAGHTGALLGYMGSLFTLGSLISVALLMSVTVTSLLLLGLLVVVLALLPIRSWMQEQAGSSLSRERELSSDLSDAIRNAESIDAFFVQRAVADRLVDLSNKEVAINVRAKFVKAVISPIYATLTYAFLCLAIVAVSLLDGADIGDVAPIFLILMRALTYAQSLQGALLTSANFLPLLDASSEALTRLRRGQVVVGCQTLGSFQGLELRGAEFAYKGEALPAVCIPEVVIRRGDRVGVVGASGSGKSTFGRILVGLMEPSVGRVFVNGVERSDFNKMEWSRLAAFVPQRVELIAGSISNNVRYFRQDIGDDDVVRALEQANILDEILDLPEGLKTELGAGEHGLSGGQCQRLGIARALAGNPQFLIMDEPTAALDYDSERAILQTLDELPESLTLVVISHRGAILTACSRILRIEEGVVLGDT